MQRVMKEGNVIRQQVLDYVNREVLRKGLAYVSSPHCAVELKMKTRQFGAAMRALRVASESNSLDGISVEKYNNKWLVRKK